MEGGDYARACTHVLPGARQCQYLIRGLIREAAFAKL